ncbi:MAG: RluA family pseudouridine synthase [Sedimentisphaerales bacterium]|nr:RluA family pseudouridine synthase [Sedimentisphaerales bacterium]
MTNENNNLTEDPSSPANEGVYEVDDDGAQHAYLIIKRLLPNRRIDKYIKHRFPDFSRNVIQGLIKEEAVTVNGKKTKASYNLNPGDRVDLVLPPPPTNEIPPEEIPLNILYEDDHMIALNKQPYLVVHPARGNRGGTLVNGLVYYSDSLSTINGSFRPGIVHRLDRNTTGVIVVAKTDTAHWRLAHQFEYRQTQKTYVAVVHGTMELDSDVIDVPLGRHPRVREKYAARPDSGKEATTLYEVEKQYQGYALLRLKPKTGRTHQLRVHLSISKHPIVADTMYGGKQMTLSQLSNGQPVDPALAGNLGPDDIVIDRQALHAASLEINHPISAKPMHFEAPLPPDMQRLVDLLDTYRA